MSERPLILIVDDEPTIITTLQLCFEEEPWDIHAAEDASSALALVRENDYALLLVDKNLPDFDGVALIEQVRLAKKSPRIVMMTGFASVGSAIDTANLGIDAYIEKPFDDLFEVRELVERLLAEPRIAEIRARIAEMAARTRTSSRPEAPDVEPVDPRPVIGVLSDDPKTVESIRTQLSAASAEMIVVDSLKGLVELVAEGKLSAMLLHETPDVLSAAEHVRKVSASTPILVAESGLGLPTLKALIALRITGVLTFPVDSKAYGIRIRQLVRGIADGAPDG